MKNDEIRWDFFDAEIFDGKRILSGKKALNVFATEKRSI